MKCFIHFTSDLIEKKAFYSWDCVQGQCATPLPVAMSIQENWAKNMKWKTRHLIHIAVLMVYMFTNWNKMYWSLINTSLCHILSITAIWLLNKHNEDMCSEHFISNIQLQGSEISRHGLCELDICYWVCEYLSLLSHLFNDYIILHHRIKNSCFWLWFTEQKKNLQRQTKSR